MRDSVLSSAPQEYAGYLGGAPSPFTIFVPALLRDFSCPTAASGFNLGFTFSLAISYGSHIMQQRFSESRNIKFKEFFFWHSILLGRVRQKQQKHLTYSKISEHIGHHGV